MKEKTRLAYRYALERLQEASSWRGISLLLGVAGATMNPEQKDAFIFGGLTLAGFIGAVFPDKRK